MRPDYLSHILSRVTKTEAGCWISGWCKDRKGYTQIWRDGQMRGVHREVYLEAVGPIPEGMVIDHLCNNPPCCNPEHLEAVTPTENTRRSWISTPHERRKLVGSRRRTHCPNGHAYADHGFMVAEKRFPGRWYQSCRTCQKERRQAA
jgi:hypothetical protein